MKNKLLAVVAAGLLAGLAIPAQATPVIVNFQIDTVGPTAGTFTFDSSLQGGVIGYSDLSTFSITLWTGSTYDLAFINTGTFDFLEFAFDSSTDMFLDLSNASGMISAIRSSLSDGFWVAGPGVSCSGLGARCVADYPGPVFGANGTFDTITVTRVGTPVPEPGTLALVGLGLGLAGFGAARRRKLG